MFKRWAGLLVFLHRDVQQKLLLLLLLKGLLLLLTELRERILQGQLVEKAGRVPLSRRRGIAAHVQARRGALQFDVTPLFAPLFAALFKKVLCIGAVDFGSGEAGQRVVPGIVAAELAELLQCGWSCHF